MTSAVTDESEVETQTEATRFETQTDVKLMSISDFSQISSFIPASVATAVDEQEWLKLVNEKLGSSDIQQIKCQNQL